MVEKIQEVPLKTETKQGDTNSTFGTIVVLATLPVAKT